MCGYNMGVRAVRDSIGGITWSAGIGGILVVLIVLIFLRSVRSSLIVLLAIPMAILYELGNLLARAAYRRAGHSDADAA